MIIILYYYFIIIIENAHWQSWHFTYLLTLSVSWTQSLMVTDVLCQKDRGFRTIFR